ncbi:MAG: metal-dependent hydrolase [Polyangiaceae bacterium]|nr:metal-dependent hydrolase [Polyangiaceae bacterium]
MENVTHALAGALVAEIALGLRHRRAPTSATLARHAYAVSAIANNVPDADILYDTILTKGKLGYLLHHRGYTHTAVVGVALGLLVAGAIIALARVRNRAFSASEERFLLGLGALGPLVHVSMDGWNNYGVHPLWPFYDGWLYGDTIFIVEPLLYVVAIPPLIMLRRARWWRGLLGLLLVAMLALVWLVPRVVPLPLRISLTVVAFVTGAAAFALSRRSGLWPNRLLAVGGWAFVVVTFATTSAMARARVHARVAAEDPASRLVDVALTPMPANPLCYYAVAIGESGGDVILQYSVVAPIPALRDASACPAPFEHTTAPRLPPEAPADPGTRPLGTFRGSVAELRELARRCDVGAALRFMRAPFWVERNGQLIVGDARFDRDEEIDFAEVVMPPDSAGVTCPRNVPPWTPPRRDILDGP